eukprot:3873675-Prymnesium_polylepis.1
MVHEGGEAVGWRSLKASAGVRAGVYVWSAAPQGTRCGGCGSPRVSLVVTCPARESVRVC